MRKSTTNTKSIHCFFHSTISFSTGPLLHNPSYPLPTSLNFRAKVPGFQVRGFLQSDPGARKFQFQLQISNSENYRCDHQTEVDIYSYIHSNGATQSQTKHTDTNHTATINLQPSSIHWAKKLSRNTFRKKSKNEIVKAPLFIITIIINLSNFHTLISSHPSIQNQ